jgi:hypothetical protein
MAEQLVTLQLSPIFNDFRSRVEGLRDSILADGRTILRREWALSVRARFFDTGAGLQSAGQGEVIEEGHKKTYRLIPQAFYMTFGEYGTGRRGSATGRPAPAGYRYGDKPGMAARRFSRIAVSIAAPQVRDMAIQKTRQFARHVTVS